VSNRAVSVDELEERARLEAERDFLLQSLDDLEAERASGGIDDESYRALHDDYTARAAATIRALRDGVDARPVAAPVPFRRRATVIAAIVVFAVAIGVSLAYALGARLPGQTSSGNSQSTVATGALDRCTNASARIPELEKTLAAKADDIESRLLLARLVECQGRLVDAVREYDTIRFIDPTSVRAEANSGRVLYLAAVAVTSSAPNQATQLFDQSRARLDRAVQMNPQYPDVRFFRAIVLAKEYQEFELAQADLQRYLVLAPNGPYAADARAFLQQVTNAIESPTTTTTTKKGT